MPATTKRIHRDLADDNCNRRDHMIRLVGEMLSDASYFVAGQGLDVSVSAPSKALSEAMEYLIRNTFHKMSYLKSICADQKKEIQAVLRSNDIGQYNLNMDKPESNPKAIADLRKYIDLCKRTNQQIVLGMLTKRYALRPYGWPEFEVVLLLARLIMAGEAQCVSGGEIIRKDKLYEALTSKPKWRNITIIQRARTRSEDIQKARELGRDVFSEMGPKREDPLCEFLKDRLEGWLEKLSLYRALAETGRYPGSTEIADGIRILQMLIALEDSNRFLVQVNEQATDLRDLAESFHNLDHFYKHQRPMWDKLRTASGKFRLNKMELERDDSAGPALRRMREILSTPNPYGLIKEAEGLIGAVGKVNEGLLSERRIQALATIAEQSATVIAEVSKAGGDESLKKKCLKPLENLAKQVSTHESLAHISQAEAETVVLKDQALDQVERFLSRKAEDGKAGQKKPMVKPRRIVSPVKLVKLPYLESQADVDAFLDDLRKELTNALARNQRIEIR